MMERNTLPLLGIELAKAPNSPTWPLLCAQPLGTLSSTASRRRAHKTKEVPTCDFQVSLTCLEYHDLFHSCGPDTNAMLLPREIVPQNERGSTLRFPSKPCFLRIS